MPSSRRPAAILALLIGFATPALADPAAEQLFQDGRQLLKDGHLDEACDKFDKSQHAHCALFHLLIEEGKLTAKHVSDALKRREHLIHELRQRLAALEGGAVSAIERVGRRVARKVTTKAKRRMSPARSAALKPSG